MAELEGEVSFYQDHTDRLKGFKGFIRGSLGKFKEEDGSLIFKLLKEAEEKPQKKKNRSKEMEESSII